MPHGSVCSAPLHAQAGAGGSGTLALSSAGSASCGKGTGRAGNVLDKFPRSVQSGAMTMLGEMWQAPSLIRLWSRTIPFVMKGRALAGRELPEAAA